jgi:tRNA pseudouridine38-40 synthase
VGTYRLTVEYDGSEFHGWQRQPALRTAEGELRAALRRVVQDDVELTAAGRIDAGAHAHGQAVGVSLPREWPADRLRLALNAVLPRDVTVSAATAAPAGFHARHDAVRRTYRYLVVPRRVPVARRFAWEVSGDLDLAAMRRGAEIFRGRHDFAAFGSSPRPGGTTVRTIADISVRRVSGLGGGEGFSAVVIEVGADAFLRGMMRGIAGALVALGTGRLTSAELAGSLDVSLTRPARATVAPARGLHQWSVTYADAGSPDAPAPSRGEAEG